MLRRIVVAGIAAGVLVVGAVPAWAHVTLSPESVVKGGSDVEVTFRVPNEETTATTKLQVFIPADPPFLGVLAQSVPGWTDAVVTTKLAKPIHTDDGDVTDVVSEVTWTATSAATGIKPGEFQKFEILVGQVPDTATAVTLKALQTYANGDIVRWIEDPTGENPAPILNVTAAESPGSTGSTPATTAATTPTAQVSTKGFAKSSDVDSARTIGVIGIVVGALGLLGAGAALALRRGER